LPTEGKAKPGKGRKKKEEGGKTVKRGRIFTGQGRSGDWGPTNGDMFEGEKRPDRGKGLSKKANSKKNDHH